MRARSLSAWLLPALLLAGSLTACTEDGLTGVDDSAPGNSAPTLEILVPADRLPVWQDMTFRGYALASDAGFRLVADDGELRARSLVRFATTPDSAGSPRAPFDSVTAVNLWVLPDTLSSRLPGDSVLLEVFVLGREFDADEATWEEAAAGEEWSEPGGDLGERVGHLRFAGLVDTARARDTLRVPFDRPDSLFAAWTDAGTPPPMALRVVGDGSRLFLRRFRLEVTGFPAEQDSADTGTAVPEEHTFIFDPPQAEPGAALRLGGLPSSRVYFTFLPPDSAEGIALRGARVNRAELLFRSAGLPPAAHRLEESLSALAVELLADPRRFGARTPVGDAVGDRRRLITLDPDSLAAGVPVAVRVDTLVQAWANTPPDSVQPFHLGLRPVPDGGNFGFWEFGSEASEVAPPVLRLLVTPPADFEVP